MIFSLLALPLKLLNLFGVVVAVVWLAILGEWAAIGTALLAMILGVWFCGLLLMPGTVLFAMPGALLVEKGGVLTPIGYLFGFVGLLSSFAAISIWTIGSFFYFLIMANGVHVLPFILAAYGVATAPWVFLASKEDNEYSMFSNLIQQIGCAFAIVMLIVGGEPLSTMYTFITIMGIGFILEVVGVGVISSKK